MMPRFSSVLLAAAYVTALPCHAQDNRPAPAAATWIHERSDLKPDPKVVWGKLDNGLRYAILPHAEPPQRVTVRLYINTGSLMETDAQQGLAHFLEHMAFNGTTHYPSSEMVEFFQRLGMAFGADTNAHTSFKETVYKLELPENSKEFLDKGMLFMADVAGGMLLAGPELEKERGVIMSEKLARDDVDYRMMIEGFKFTLPDSLIPRRLPIGTEEVVNHAPRQEFVDYYKKWYTPDRMTAVVVGDVDPAMVAGVIREKFGVLQAPARTVPDPDLGPVTPATEITAKLLTEKEAGQVTLSVDKARPSRKRPDNTATQKEDLIRGLADVMVNRRFEILAKKADSPFLAAEVSADDWMHYVESSSLQLTAKPENWDKALAAGEQEIRRAVLHGFTKAELDEARANTLNSWQNAARTAETRKSRALADALVKNIAADEVFQHPKDTLAWVESVLPGITPEQCHELFARDWKPEGARIFVAGNLSLENAPETIAGVWKKSQAAEVTAPVEEAGAAFAYTDFGPEGKVASQKVVDDLQITQVTFANGVRLNIKPTDFNKDSIQIALQFGDGLLTLPKDKPGLDTFTGATMDLGGLGKHSVDDLQRLLAGKTVGTGFSIGEDSFVLAGRTNRQDLLLECQLLAAALSDPGWREDGVSQFRENLPNLYQQVEHTPEGILQTKAKAFTHGSDYRFVLPDEKTLASRNMAEVKAWLEPAMKSSFLEIGVVGDCDPQEVIAAMSRTLGALPARAQERVAHDDLRTVKFPAGEKDKEFTFQSKITKSIVSAYWPTTDRRDNIRQSRQLTLVGEILSDRVRLKVREELGESYSPDVRSLMSDVWPGYGQMAAFMIAEPQNAKQLGDIARELGGELASKGATADELDRARKPLLTMLQEQRRNNNYWLLTVVTPSQSQPQRLDWARSMVDDFSSASLEDLNALAAKYLKPDNATIVRIVSKQE